MDLYNNIKRLRKEMKMSQAELASKVGYNDRSTIARVEKGEIDLSIDKIHLFAKALNVSASELMGMDGVNITNPSEQAEDHFELITLYERLSVDDKALIKSMMISLQNKKN